MLLIFWDTKEKSEIKQAIVKKLSGVETSILSPLVKGETKEGVDESKSEYTAKIIFTGSKNIKFLNKTYRKINKVTDVLSFAELDLDKNFPALKETKSLGEIYINYDWIKRDHNPTKLAIKLLLHGYLHLLGYDHEKDRGEMEKLEKKLSSKILAKF